MMQIHPLTDVPKRTDKTSVISSNLTANRRKAFLPESGQELPLIHRFFCNSKMDKKGSLPVRRIVIDHLEQSFVLVFHNK